jgi:hypothetical protein
MMAADAQLRIEVSDPSLVRSLRNFMEHTIYSPTAPEEGVVLLKAPQGLPHHIAYAEVSLYLEAWRRLHPRARVSLTD